MLIFMFFWHFLVYCPIAHSEWAQDGFLGIAGDLDFAGGNVVHICSGFTGLAAAIIGMCACLLVCMCMYAIVPYVYHTYKHILLAGM